MSNPFQSIAPTTLDSITGGTGRSPSTSSSSSTTDPLLQSLSGLQDSIKSLAAPQNTSNNTMMFLMMAMAMNRPAPGVVVVGGGRRGWW